MSKVWGGIEAGGTHFACAVGSGPDDVRAQVRFTTTTPEDTLAGAVRFFASQTGEGELEGVGIASFGPLDADTDSPTYGHITSTPKPAWVNTNVVGPVRDSLKVPVAFDTDVNGAALAERKWGAARELDTFIYLTVGTGIGGGGMVNGQLMHGLVHPEMGHARVPHDRSADPFAGSCPYHGDCLEGLASGPSIERRWGRPADQLPDDHEAWDLEAAYLALGVANLICTLSPQRVVMGGGVMERQALLPLVRTKVIQLLGGYIQARDILYRIDRYIVAPDLGVRVGVLGAIALAMDRTA